MLKVRRFVIWLGIVFSILACLCYLAIAQEMVEKRTNTSLEGCYQWDVDFGPGAPKKTSFLWFHKNGFVHEGELKKDKSGEARLATYDRQGEYVYIHLPPEWQQYRGGLDPYNPPTLKHRIILTYRLINDGQGIIQMLEWELPDRTGDAIAIPKVKPPKKLIELGTAKLKYAKAKGCPDHFTKIRFADTAGYKTLHGLYEAKPLPKGYLPPQAREFLCFVSNSYVYHGILTKKGKKHLDVVYYYKCRGNKLWICMGTKEDFLLLEEGTISSDGKRIHLISRDPDARSGLFPLDRVLTRSSRQLEYPESRIRGLGFQWSD